MSCVNSLVAYDQNFKNKNAIDWDNARVHTHPVLILSLSISLSLCDVYTDTLYEYIRGTDPNHTKSTNLALLLPARDYGQASFL